SSLARLAVAVAARQAVAAGRARGVAGPGEFQTLDGFARAPGRALQAVAAGDVRAALGAVDRAVAFTAGVPGGLREHARLAHPELQIAQAQHLARTVGVGLTGQHTKRSVVGVGRRPT